jgi:hypothetical protein
MPGWPRILLVVVAFAISAINGIETGEGALDFIGGCMLFAALLWPGAEYAVQGPNSFFTMKRRLGWPSAQEWVRHLQEDYGHPPPWSPANGLDGIVTRQWGFPFPTSWATARDYSTEFTALGVRVLSYRSR